MLATLSNSRKLYVFSFFIWFIVLMPVVVPFFLHLGLTMSEVFQLQAIFGLTVALGEFPAGYLCDLYGRKKILIAGSLLAFVSTLYLLSAHSFLELCIYEIIGALGTSLISGADVSLLYDTIGTMEKRERTKSLANMQFASVAGESSAAVASALLISTSYQPILIVNAITSLIPFLIALTFEEKVFCKIDKGSHLNNIRAIFSHLTHSTDKIFLLAFVNCIVWALSSFIMVWLFQKYWTERKIPIEYFGYIWAFYNLSIGVIGQQVHRIEHKLGATPLLIALGASPIIGYLGMGFSGGYLGVALGVSFYFSRGINQVLLKDIINWRTPPEFRASINSLVSCFFRLSFAVIGPGVGFLIDARGIDFALTSLGISFGLAFFLVLRPLIHLISTAHIPEIPEG